MGPSYLIVAKQNKYAGPMIIWPYIGLNSLLRDMVDICDQPRAISNHYETTLLPEIYRAVSNYFFWGVSASRPPPAQDMQWINFYGRSDTEDAELRGVVTSTWAHSYIPEMPCPSRKQKAAEI